MSEPEFKVIQPCETMPNFYRIPDEEFMNGIHGVSVGECATCGAITETGKPCPRCDKAATDRKALFFS